MALERMLKEEKKLVKDGNSSLPTHDITRRLPDSGGGEGRRRRGMGASRSLTAASARVTMKNFAVALLYSA